MEQLERIAHMEGLLDEGIAAVRELEAALERYQSTRAGRDELFGYYFGPLWRQDLEADRTGVLPAGLKRGVLSEDAVYDLFTDCRRLEQLLRRPSKE